MVIHLLNKVCNSVLPRPLYVEMRSLYFNLFDGFSRKSYSQDGEDLIIASFFENKYNHGFYVDVGAHHPKRFSNTYFFYKCGWRGINIDATPGSMKSFNLWRSRDINIEAAISSEIEPLDYYIFTEPALNGFEGDITKQYVSSDNCKLVSIVKIKASPLKDVFDQYLPLGQRIDFLSVDVEGMDLSVLESNDWGQYRPKYIVVELLGDIGKINDQNEVVRFLHNHGYTLCAKSRLNGIFFDSLVLDNK